MQAMVEWTLAEQEEIEWSMAQQVIESDNRRNSIADQLEVSELSEDDENTPTTETPPSMETLRSTENRADFTILAGYTWAIKVTADGIVSNPEVPTDEGAKAVFAALAPLAMNL